MILGRAWLNQVDPNIYWAKDSISFCQQRFHNWDRLQEDSWVNAPRSKVLVSDPTVNAISFSHLGFKWDQPQQTPSINKSRHVEQMSAFEKTFTSWPLKTHISGNCNPILDRTQMLIFCLSVMNRTTREVVYTLMQIVNIFFSKMQPTEKAPKPIRIRLGRDSRSIWKPIRANMLHNFLYILAFSSNQHDYNTDPNIPNIAIVNKIEIWAICKAKSTNAFLFK